MTKIETFVERSVTKKYLVETRDLKFYVGVLIIPETGERTIKILSKGRINGKGTLSPGEIDDAERSVIDIVTRHEDYCYTKEKTDIGLSINSPVDGEIYNKIVLAIISLLNEQFHVEKYKISNYIICDNILNDVSKE